MFIEYKNKSDSMVQFCKGNLIYEDDMYIHISGEQEMCVYNIYKGDLEYIIIHSQCAEQKSEKDAQLEE